MTTSQLLVYGVLALLLIALLRKFLLARSVVQYSPGEVAERIRGSALLLDVRTERERHGHTIKGSLHIPLQSLTLRADELKAHREREIICFCQSGNRSITAAAKLKRLGFTTASMKGGIAEWNFSQRKR